MTENIFRNAPLTDFAIENERIRLKEEINIQFSKLSKAPYEIHGYIGSDNISHGTELAVNQCPEDLNLTFSKTHEVNINSCEAAINSLKDSISSWAETDVEIRAGILEKAADILTKRKHELSAIMVLEVGKPWIEADADVAEAIDFCRYYAIEARKLFTQKKLGKLQGEHNLYFYEPRGITLVISPWNFPMAIPCGMFAASLVTGNCTILKPAEQSPVIAKATFDIFLEAGLPNNVAAFLPGKGEIIGDYMSKHIDISTIVFTGSKEVGLKLIETGGHTKSGQVHVKKVIAEMGGKNAIVIDSDADIDEAVKGVLYSAFGFEGQKCSACSRVYVTSQSVFEIFTKRFKEAVNDLIIGPASEPGSYAGPVVSKESKDKILKYINKTKAEYPILAQANISEELLQKGHFVPPTAFSNIPEDHKIMRDEIFGPVVVINPVKTFEEGIKKAINSDYRLTGGVFSRSPANINYAIKHFNVGNLYINRGCTGALVYRQPFGGAFMSGVGSKAGGPDYLLQFVVPRVVCENTMRRGFAPENN